MLPEIVVCFFTLAIVAGIGWLIARFFWERHMVDDLADKAVFITGCDSGFGQAIANKCAHEGMTVFAGCLTEKGIEALKNADERIHAFPNNVTNDESVNAARKYVEDHLDGKKLWAVINNAGIFAAHGPFDWCTVDNYRDSFEVNCLGGIRVTKAFSSLIKESHGRIISVSSVAGLFAPSGYAPYSTAKYGVEAWMDVLRREYASRGIKCCLIEPAGFKTGFVDEDAMENRLADAWSALSPQLKAEYGDEFMEQYLLKWNALMKATTSSKIHHVVDNVFHAVAAVHPRERYLCGWQAYTIWAPAMYLPTALGDKIDRSNSAALPRPKLMK